MKKTTVKRKSAKISLHSLMVFHKVAEKRSFTRAAKALAISQPAVTKHVKNLELTMGISLIDRDQRNFTLSDVGRALFRITRKISSHLVEVEGLFTELEREHVGELRIGTTEAYATCLFPDLLSDFKAAYPFVRITFNLGTSEEVERSLLTYKSDLGLVGIAKRSPKFVSVSLLREDLVVITHPSHPLANSEVISLKETTGYPFILRGKGSTTRRIVREAFDSLGVYPDTLMEAASSEFIKEWVTRGKSISIVARTTVAEEERTGLIKTIPLLDDLYIDVAFVYLKEGKSEPPIKSIKAFINCAKNWVAQNKFGS